MKRSFYLLTIILAVSTVSCNGQSDENKAGETANKVQAKPAIVSTAINSSPVSITKADFLKLVVDYEKNPNTWIFLGDKPCLIDFYADWCGPCRITSPILEDLAKQYAGKINFYKVDVDREQELAAVFGVQSIPSFLFCPLKGNPTISSGIANSREATKNMFIKQIEELLLKNQGSSPTI